MRLQVGRRIASAMLAFILLVVGMCVESLRPADFYLMCNRSEASDAVVSNPSHKVALERMYTPHVLRQSTATYFNAICRRSVPNREFKIHMAYIAVESILAQMCACKVVADNIAYSVPTSHASIVNYIQLQDGKK